MNLYLVIRGKREHLPKFIQNLLKSLERAHTLEHTDTLNTYRDEKLEKSISYLNESNLTTIVILIVFIDTISLIRMKELLDNTGWRTQSLEMRILDQHVIKQKRHSLREFRGRIEWMASIQQTLLCSIEGEHAVQWHNNNRNTEEINGNKINNNNNDADWDKDDEDDDDDNNLTNQQIMNLK